MEIEVKSIRREKEITLLQFAAEKQNTIEYIDLSQAIKADKLIIKEMNNEGDVNNLAVFNLTKKYVFIMDGDILEGAKQNRVVNTSVLLSPNSKIILPVSCVEQGRWDFTSDQFTEANYTAPINLRAKKAQRVRENLEQDLGHESNQGEVWDDVQNYSMSFQVNSNTSNLSDVIKKKQRYFDKFINSFNLGDDANGIAVFVRKQLLSIDLFNRTDIYKQYFNKILKSVAFESFKLNASDKHPSDAEVTYKVRDFFDSLGNLEFTEYDSPGVGIEKRFQTDSHTGTELNYKEHLIHLTALNIISNNNIAMN